MNRWLISTCESKPAPPTIHYALSAPSRGRRSAGRGAGQCARDPRVCFARRGGGAARSPPAVNKKALESLAAAGAFDCLGNRAAAFAAIEPMLAIASRR